MAVTYGFFNSVNGDRKYNAEQMSEYFRGIINEGVYQHLDGGLAVTAGTGLAVNVAAGRAIIQNRWIQNSAAMSLTIAAASETYARKDAVVIRLNWSSRAISIAVKTGTPAASPVAPSMTRSSTTYEMALAYVNVAANATSVTVTDKRSDSTVCGWVTVAQSTSGEVDAMLNDMKTGFDGVVYPTPGDAVRSCDQVLDDRFSPDKNYTVNESKYHDKGSVSITGWETGKKYTIYQNAIVQQTDANRACINVENCIAGEHYTVDAIANFVTGLYFIITYDSNNAPIRTFTGDAEEQRQELIIGDNEVGFVVNNTNSTFTRYFVTKNEPIKLMIKQLSVSFSSHTSQVLKPDGTTTSAGSTSAVSDPIKVKGLKKIVYKYGIDNAALSGLSFTKTDHYPIVAADVVGTVGKTAHGMAEVSVPNGANYVWLSNEMNVVGTVTGTPELYGIVDYDVILGIEDEIDDIESLIGNIESETITPDFTVNADKYMKPSDGSLNSLPGYTFAVSGAIQIPDDATFVRVRGDVVDNASILIVGFYTNNTVSSASFISGYSPCGTNAYVPVPMNAKYVFVAKNTNSSGVTPSALEYDFIKNTYLPTLKSAIEEHSIVDVYMHTPTKYDLIVGDTFELFYKGIIKSWKDDGFLVQADCSIGSNYDKKYMVTPTTAGNVSLNLKLFDPTMTQKDDKTITLAVHSTPTNPDSVKNILCVGDSLTSPGKWPAEMKRRLSGNGGSPSGFNLSNIHFVGTVEKEGVNYEGYGGWTFNSFNTANVNPEFKLITCTHDKTEAEDQHSIYKDSANNQWKLETINTGSIKIILTSGSAATFPSTGTLTWVSGGVNHSNITYTASENAPGNPFWDSSQNKVDFGTYATRIGVSSIDYVFVLIGWNSAGSTKTSYKTQAQTFIDNVKASFPNAKIVLMGLQIPARNGLGNNYGATGTWSKYIGLMNYVHDLDDWYDELVASNTNVSHINISGQFDTEHNMPQSTRAVNTRNTETEVYQTNGVHPANSGYLQIADAAVRAYAGL